MPVRKRRDGYTQEELDYLRKIADMTGRTNKEITEMFNLKFNKNKTVDAIIGAKSRYKIKSYTRIYTEEQLNYLREITPGRTKKEITKMFNERFNDNRTEKGIDSIRKDKGILTGNTGRFEKGNLPRNTVEVGTTTIDGDGYHKTKIAEPNVWELTHRLIWEKYNGAIPEGYNIIFGDGDKNNLDIENLVLVSKHELLVMNKLNLIQESAELTKVGKNIARLHIAIGDKRKKK
ncbi:HNH endonuclease signature motif containing protein [Tissierella sp.]|uniref:HNH endonuclease signature motif containing protein n=1 Tax=Tissierella sp. TaxID=41274 RepID=UPI003032BC11